MPISTAYLYACSTRRRPALLLKSPLAGAQGHGVLHAYQHGVSLCVLYEERPALRFKSPRAGPQGRAVLHAYQHGVSLRVLNEAASRAPL